MTTVSYDMYKYVTLVMIKFTYLLYIRPHVQYSSTPLWLVGGCLLFLISGIPFIPLCCRDWITTTILRPFFRDHPGEPVPEKNFWILWCKGRLTEADTPTIWLSATPSWLSSAHLHHPHVFYRADVVPTSTISPYFLKGGCLSCRPTNSIKAL